MASLSLEVDTELCGAAQCENGCAAPSLKAILRKVGWHLLPIFFVLNCLNYLDRTNLAFASIQMSGDLQLSQKEYGTGAGLFFVGYAFFQIPSQLVLRRVGAPVWLAAIVTMWGAVACCMAAIQGEVSFYALRLILGVAESGNFPGYWYYLTKWYPDKHIAVPYSITDSALMIAQVVGAPLAAGVLHLDGLADLRGWQWLFIVEGVPTALLGLALPLCLPLKPDRAKWLQAHEADAIQAAVTECRGSEDALARGGISKLLRTAFTHREMYLLGGVKFAKDLTGYGLMFWAPVLIRNLLHAHKTGAEDSCKAWAHPAKGLSETGYVEVLLAGVPYSLAATMNVVFAWHSQRTKERRWHIMVAYGAAGLLCALLPVFSNMGVVAGFICLTLVITLSLCPNGCLLALASAEGQGPAMPLNLAVFNSLGNIAGFFGSMLLGVVVDKTCSYNAAYVIMGIVLIAGGVLALAVADRPAGAAHEREALNGGVQSGAIIARRTDIEMSWQEDDADGADSMHKSGPGLPATDLDSVHDEM